MSITENSLFVRFFLSLWLCLKNAAANSALGRVCDRLEGWFLRQAENSAICTFVWPDVLPSQRVCGIEHSVQRLHVVQRSAGNILCSK